LNKFRSGRKVNFGDRLSSSGICSINEFPDVLVINLLVDVFTYIVTLVLFLEHLSLGFGCLVHGTDLKFLAKSISVVNVVVAKELTGGHMLKHNVISRFNTFSSTSFAGTLNRLNAPNRIANSLRVDGYFLVAREASIHARSKRL